MTTDVEITATAIRGTDGGIARRCRNAIRLYLDKRRERLALSLLTENELRDIGLSPCEAKTEVEKSWFWA